MFGLNGVVFAAETLNGTQINTIVEKAKRSGAVEQDFVRELNLLSHYLYWKYQSPKGNNSFDAPGHDIKTQKDLEDQKKLVIENAKALDGVRLIPSEVKVPIDPDFLITPYLERVNITDDPQAFQPLYNLYLKLTKNPPYKNR